MFYFSRKEEPSLTFTTGTLLSPIGVIRSICFSIFYYLDGFSGHEVYLKET